MKPKPETTWKLTRDQILGARPAVFTGLLISSGKLVFACYPAARFPRHRGAVILKRKQFDSAALAKEWAAAELIRRKARYLAKFPKGARS